MTHRPAPVTAARWLLLLVAILPLAGALLGVALVDDLRAAYIAAYGGVLGGGSVTSPRNLSPGASSAEITAQMGETMPGWYVPATIVLAAASVLGILLVAGLLALPASNAYFRGGVRARR